MSKTKNDIAKIISSEINVTNKNALNLLNTFLNIVKDKSSNQTVKISGFGTFKNKTTKSRVGRNPKTKESYTINSFKKIIFKPHNRLKNTLNWYNYASNNWIFFMKNIQLAFIFSIFLVFSSKFYAQNMPLPEGLDENFINSLPEEIRDDILSEMQMDYDKKSDSISKRPSAKLSTLNTVQDWENFQKNQKLLEKSERYGLKLFSTMQSSFMPINEPNFGSNYVIDYGDFLTIQVFGNKSDIPYEVEVQRDGSIILQDIGKVVVAGNDFTEVSRIIKAKYKSAFIGIDVVVTLSQIRDINVLITGDVQFPGIYTLAGNSNVLQVLNMAGGITENGSLRTITIKRKNKEDLKTDLYKALLFGDIDNIPFLQSGDSIHVEPAQNLVRAGYGFNREAIFELKDDETIHDLITFAGGLNIEAKNNDLSLVRFKNDQFESQELKKNQYKSLKLQHLDSLYVYKDQLGTIEISGNVKHPGKYYISSSDRLLDILNRAGGYTETAYPFAGKLIRKSAIDLEASMAEKSYQELIKYILTYPGEASSASGDGIAYLLAELKNFEPAGRVIAEFDKDKLKTNIQENIYLSDGDKIHIPPYISNVYILGEVGNPGSVLFKENASITDYINKSGGLTKFSSNDSIFVIDPNGETTKANINGVYKFIDQDITIYPGSVIYVSRNIGKIEGIELYATIAPIFSSLALSIASINALNSN